MAITDGLTRTLNRKAFLKRLEEELSRMSRENSFFCLIMFNINYFKRVNDKCGRR
ncbi:MAG: hypothetical protein CVV02_18590 [Firmicutes bacterium HGW-Firmicutes-7]|nr:MAG: hypothetical protein CVV02_18590 [Firmicutes bacterium HGW-Firmicutes-7]